MSLFVVPHGGRVLARTTTRVLPQARYVFADGGDNKESNSGTIMFKCVCMKEDMLIHTPLCNEPQK